MALELEGFLTEARFFDLHEARQDIAVALLPSTDLNEPDAGEADASEADAREADPMNAVTMNPATMNPATMNPATMNPATMNVVRAPTKRQPRMEAVPEAAPAFLNLITVPSVTVYIAGRSYGRTPMRRREVPSGHIVLELRPDEGQPRRVPIDAEPGQTIAVPRVVLSE